MLITAVTLAALAFPGPELTKDQRETLSAVQKAYEANRSALGARGMIRFRGQDGLVNAANIDDIDRAMASDWRGPHVSKGLYIFDSPYGRFENVYTPEQLVAARKLIDEDHWTSTISSYRLLTDGESTLVSNFDVIPKDDKVVHNGTLLAGPQSFFRHGEAIPLSLGNPDPPWCDLGRCLRGLLEDGGKSTLLELDENAEVDGRKVMKIAVKPSDSPLKQEVIYWVDLQHGAIPLRFRVKEYVPHGDRFAVLQWVYDQPKQVSKGWLPTRWCYAAGTVNNKNESEKNMFIHEFNLEEANFDEKPDLSMFALEFPDDMPLSDADRDLGFGIRKIWHVKDFSPSARAKARPLRTPPVVAMPEMPDAREPWSWSALLLIFAGAILLLLAGVGTIRRVRHAA